MRLDIYVSKKCNIARNKAQFMIKQWIVSVDGFSVKKSSFRIKNDEIIDILENKFQQYVSRSAIKLKDFLSQAQIDLKWKLCLDVWASTGGFTQVMLENGASNVVSLDVGTNQLHKNIEWNENVLSIEKTDIRDFETNIKFDFIVVDVSFISLKLIIDKIFELIKEWWDIVFLYKPQFEVWRKNINKKWVAKSKMLVKEKLKDFIIEIESKGKTVIWTRRSILEGKKWNREWFIFVSA